MIGTSISENVSEKRRRGRPRRFAEGYEKGMEGTGLYGSGKTRRSRVNALYRQEAAWALLEAVGQDGNGFGEFSWLCNEGTGEPLKEHKTILSELGRIEDSELLVEMARELCRLKPKTKDAVAMIRRVRSGEHKAGDALQLANEIIEALNGYMVRYPATLTADVLSALATVEAQVRK